MSERPATVSPTTMTVSWRQLRSAALSAIQWGWPITPGTYLGPDRCWHGRQDAQWLCPAPDNWQHAPLTTAERVEQIWSQAPYGVLLVCGQGVDVLELPHRMRGLLSALTGAPVVPIAATGVPPRFLVFTASGLGTLWGDLALTRVRLHAAGAWVALPPTHVLLLSPQRWWNPPPDHESPQLRPAQQVQDVLVTALLTSGLDTGTDDDED